PRGILDRTQTEVSQSSGGKQVPFVLSLPVDEFYFVKPPPPPGPRIVEVDPKLKPGDKRENPKDGRQLLYSWIPNGRFKMGCGPADKECLKDESPQHDVKITNPFWMTSTEVTFLAYQKFAESTNHAPPLKTKVNENGRRTDVPVTNISWSDAKDYCTWA